MEKNGSSSGDVNRSSPFLHLCYVHSEHALSVGCSSLIRDVVVETGLCKDVDKTHICIPSMALVLALFITLQRQR